MSPPIPLLSSSVPQVRLHTFSSTIQCEYEEQTLMTVHRDLKPENVLYKTESHHSPIVIADFGIAKHLEYDVPDPTTASPSSSTSTETSPRQNEGEGDLSKEGGGKIQGGEKEEEEPREGGVDSFAGSFGYAAPEVLLGLRHGLKVDCWSIGYVPSFISSFLLAISCLSLVISYLDLTDIHEDRCRVDMS